MKHANILVLGMISSFFLVSSFLNPVSAQKPDDKIVKIRNYGWYVANTRVDYELNDGSNKIAVQQKTKLARLSDYTFYIPNSVSLTTGIGIVFSVDIIAGPRLLSIKIPSEPFCTYIYGYTFFAWAVRVDCSRF